MSNLVYQNYNNKCQGWTNPTTLLFGPQILSLSSYESPAGSSTLVSITGANFYSYSTVLFGTFNPTPYFINSNLIQFYVPNTLNYGTYPIQVYNGSVGSNIVIYTIDNASGYWLLNANSSISNTSSNGVNVSYLSRGLPIIIDSTNNIYTVPNNVNWIIGNGGAPIFIHLPEETQFNGREITIKTLGPQINNDRNKIIPLDSGVAGSLVVNGVAGNWVTLVYNGSDWVAMSGR